MTNKKRIGKFIRDKQKNQLRAFQYHIPKIAKAAEIMAETFQKLKF